MLFFVIFLPCALLAQEQLTFVAEKDTVAFSWEWDRNESVVLHRGDFITSSAEIVYDRRYDSSDEYHLLILFGEPNNRFRVFAKYFIPIDSKDTFSDSIFIDYPLDHWAGHTRSSGFRLAIAVGDADEMWVPHYYADILRGKNRDRLLEMRPNLVCLYENNHGDPIFWHEFEIADIQNGRAMFYNSVIKLGVGTHFAVRNIHRTDIGYIVNCVVSSRDSWHTGSDEAALSETVLWEQYSPGDAVTLFLHLDGDYLDIYTHGSNIHVGTFIRVGREFIAQYQSLIRTNISDLTNVQWPQRAEGSTGIPPVFVVPDSFRNETLEVTDESVTNDFEDQENVFVQQNDDVSSLPFWLWFAIIGGVVAAGVVLLLVLIVKRKK
jgi:hypothetical protein